MTILLTYEFTYHIIRLRKDGPFGVPVLNSAFSETAHTDHQTEIWKPAAQIYGCKNKFGVGTRIVASSPGNLIGHDIGLCHIPNSYLMNIWCNSKGIATMDTFWLFSPYKQDFLVYSIWKNLLEIIYIVSSLNMT